VIGVINKPGSLPKAYYTVEKQHAMIRGELIIERKRSNSEKSSLLFLRVFGTKIWK
jgi:hypothetical protein